MSENKYKVEMTMTGATQLLIEDNIYVNKIPRSGAARTGKVGICMTPANDGLDVEGQIRLTTGSTYYEGELRYKSKELWVNTGGTNQDWVPLTTNDTNYYISPNTNNYLLTASGGYQIVGESGLVYNTTSTVSSTLDMGVYNSVTINMEPVSASTVGQAYLNIYTSATGTSNSSYLSFRKKGDIDDGYILGQIYWMGALSSSSYGTGAEISVGTTERWNGTSDGVEFKIHTNANGENSVLSRIHIDSRGYTNIQNGDLIVEHNLSITGNIDNLNNLGRFSSNLIETNASSYTGLTTDYTIITNRATAGDTTIVIPAAITFPGRILNIKNMNSSTNVSLVITSGSGDSLVYASTPPTMGKGDVITLQSNGLGGTSGKWYVIGYLNVA